MDSLFRSMNSWLNTRESQKPQLQKIIYYNLLYKKYGSHFNDYICDTNNNDK